MRDRGRFDKAVSALVAGVLWVTSAPALHDPVWSPDGRFIAYYSDASGDFEVYVYDLRTKSTRRLTNSPGYDGTPAWLPDGRLSFASKRDGDMELFVADAEGNHLAQLTHNNTNELSPSWSADGKRVAYESRRDGNDDIYELEVATGSEQRITSHEARDFRPTYSPSGAIVFQSNRYGTMDLFVKPATDTATLLLGMPGAQTSPAWSPDGARIAFEQQDSTGAAIYSLDVRTREVTRLIESERKSRDTFPRWSPDSKSLVFLRADSSQARLAIVSTSSGAVQFIRTFE